MRRGTIGPGPRQSLRRLTGDRGMQTRVEKKPSTTKRMIIMIVGVLALIGIIAGIKVLMIMKMLAGMKPPPPAVVTTAKTCLLYTSPSPRD